MALRPTVLARDWLITTEHHLLPRRDLLHLQVQPDAAWTIPMREDDAIPEIGDEMTDQAKQETDAGNEEVEAIRRDAGKESCEGRSEQFEEEEGAEDGDCERAAEPQGSPRSELGQDLLHPHRAIQSHLCIPTKRAIQRKAGAQPSPSH